MYKCVGRCSCNTYSQASYANSRVSCAAAALLLLRRFDFTSSRRGVARCRRVSNPVRAPSTPQCFGSKIARALYRTPARSARRQERAGEKRRAGAFRSVAFLYSVLERQRAAAIERTLLASCENRAREPPLLLLCRAGR